MIRPILEGRRTVSPSFRERGGKEDDLEPIDLKRKGGMDSPWTQRWGKDLALGIHLVIAGWREREQAALAHKRENAVPLSAKKRQSRRFV